MSKVLIAGCVYLMSMLAGLDANAGSVTLRDIVLKPGSAELLLDTEVDRKSIEVDYVRDIVQFSISNATIYPARMLHAEKSPYSKVFAYQYSPNLVRVRFTVDHSAEKFKNKVKWVMDGKRLNIVFPAGIKTTDKDDEKSLLDKITGVVTGNESANSKADEKKLAEEKKAAEEKKLAEEKKAAEEKKLAEEKKASEEKSEGGALTGNGRKQAKLAGKSAGPSATRSFLAMVLVLGGLGLVLIYVKRRGAAGPQAKKVGNNWISGILGQNRKQKQIIEMVATHVLGPKQSVVVMKIRGQQFVLAVTAENIQLITQLDADESDLDLLDDPKVAASIGKMFGVNKEPQIEPVKTVVAPVVGTAAAAGATSEASFNSYLKTSTGAGAIIARNAYATNGNPSIQNPAPQSTVNSARDQIRRRLENMQ